MPSHMTRVPILICLHRLWDPQPITASLCLSSSPTKWGCCGGKHPESALARQQQGHQAPGQGTQQEPPWRTAGCPHCPLLWSFASHLSASFTLTQGLLPATNSGVTAMTKSCLPAWDYDFRRRKRSAPLLKPGD